MTSRPSWPAVPTTSQASDAVVLDGDDDDDAADDGLAVDLGAADAEPDAGGFAGPPHADATRPTTTRPPRSEPLRCAMDGMFGSPTTARRAVCAYPIHRHGTSGSGCYQGIDSAMAIAASRPSDVSSR